MHSNQHTQVQSISQKWTQAIINNEFEQLKHLMADTFKFYPAHSEEETANPNSLINYYQCLAGHNKLHCYERNWYTNNSASIEFTIQFEAVSLLGMELLTFDNNGKITKCEILAQTPKAVAELRKLFNDGND